MKLYYVWNEQTASGQAHNRIMNNHCQAVVSISIVHAMKAYSGSSGIALLILSFGAR